MKYTLAFLLLPLFAQAQIQWEFSPASIRVFSITKEYGKVDGWKEVSIGDSIHTIVFYNDGKMGVRSLDSFLYAVQLPDSLAMVVLEKVLSEEARQHSEMAERIWLYEQHFGTFKRIEGCDNCIQFEKTPNPAPMEPCKNPVKKTTGKPGA